MAEQRRDRDFDSEIARLVDGLRSNLKHLSPQPDLGLILGVLGRIVYRTFPALGSAESSDVADEALVRFVAAVRENRLRSDSPPAPYLVAVAKNAAISRLRQLSHIDPAADPDTPLENSAGDAWLYSLLEAVSAVQAIDAAWATAKEREDHAAMRVVTAWRDLAHQLGRAPTSREVSAKAGVSHTGVSDALRRFRSYLPGGMLGA